MFKVFLACFAVVLFFVPAPLVAENFLVGTGIYDVTGPAAEIGMMGYASNGSDNKGNSHASLVTCLCY